MYTSKRNERRPIGSIFSYAGTLYKVMSFDSCDHCDLILHCHNAIPTRGSCDERMFVIVSPRKIKCNV